MEGMGESGAQRVLKAQLIGTIRSLVIEARALALMTGAKLTDEDIASLNKLLTDAGKTADRAEQYWA